MRAQTPRAARAHLHINLRVGLADYHKTVAIYDPKTGRKWAQDDSVESNHVPLDIRSVSHDTMETATEVHLPVIFESF
jgi:hypothetical protein